MEYNKIVAITGMNGLFELLSSKTDGAIVRSLEDQSTRFVSSRVHNFSHLESIEVYTVKDNVNLVDVFKAMEQNPEPVPDLKNNALIKKYFDVVYPDMDFERVYASDMKKMLKWFVTLKGNVAFALSEPSEEAPADPEVTKEEEPVEEAALSPEAKKDEADSDAKKPVVR